MYLTKIGLLVTAGVLTELPKVTTLVCWRLCVDSQHLFTPLLADLPKVVGMRLHCRRILLIIVFILFFLGWTGLVGYYSKSWNQTKAIKYFRREQVEQELRMWVQIGSGEMRCLGHLEGDKSLCCRATRRKISRDSWSFRHKMIVCLTIPSPFAESGVWV